MSRPVRALAALFFVALPLSSQHLPKGSYNTTRERSYDLIHLHADLRVDWERRSITGRATLRLSPLTSISSVSFDAYRFTVSGVSIAGVTDAPHFEVRDRTISVELGRTVSRQDTIEVEIIYEATPTAGMYFIEPGPGTAGHPAIFTYGEGGIHANWLPLYNSPNDKFSTELIVTVGRPHVALSNGHLVSTTQNNDGSRTYHWSQSLPHSDYLLALFVGAYVPVPLRPAFGEIPLTVWVHPGQESAARDVFVRTTDMVEWFSERFSYRYPWEKYDQVAAFDYAIGAMENTSITGHNDRILRTSAGHEEFNPNFSAYASTWTAETIISHELAHHWFGNLTTYTELSHLWLNESFASYLMMLWDEHRLGPEALQASTTIALTDYLKYVREEHIIRPLEFHYFDTRDQIYNTQTTYQKGAIVLHMLRRILGDELFFTGLSHFLRKHAYGNVESNDLKVAFEESTGRNLEWFFKDWVWGGGHPVYEISSNYLRDRQLVELTVSQVQPMVDGQDLFTLPVEIRIDAGGSTVRHRVWVRDATEYFRFPVPQEPDLISFDGSGHLVADVRFPKEFDELVYQVLHDDIPGKIRALRNMAETYASDPRTTSFLTKFLQGPSHWYVKAESVLLLQSARTPTAEQLLIDQLRSKEYHIRKAAAIALGSYVTGPSRTALRNAIRTDPIDDVAATAIVSLAKTDPALGYDYLQRQATTESWYDVRTLAVLTAAESMQNDELVPLIRPFVGTSYNYAIRSQALRAWAACAPLDQELRSKVLPAAARNDILGVRTTAMSLLARLKVTEAIPLLRELAERNGDGDIRFAAREAIEEIERGALTED